jgi:hypothetical protein
MKELILILSLLQPKADSICREIQMQYIEDAKRYHYIIADRLIKYELVTTFVSDTLATSWNEDGINYIQIDLGYFISLLDEPGRFATLIYHELSHIYLELDDVKKGETIMNYKYISIDIYNEKIRYLFLNKLFR